MAEPVKVSVPGLSRMLPGSPAWKRERRWAIACQVGAAVVVGTGINMLTAPKPGWRPVVVSMITGIVITVTHILSWYQGWRMSRQMHAELTANLEMALQVAFTRPSTPPASKEDGN